MNIVTKLMNKLVLNLQFLAIKTKNLYILNYKIICKYSCDFEEFYGYSPVKFFLQIIEEKIMENFVPNFLTLDINT